MNGLFHKIDPSFRVIMAGDNNKNSETDLFF